MHHKAALIDRRGLGVLCLLRLRFLVIFKIQARGSSCRSYLAPRCNVTSPFYTLPICVKKSVGLFTVLISWVAGTSLGARTARQRLEGKTQYLLRPEACQLQQLPGSPCEVIHWSTPGLCTTCGALTLGELDVSFCAQELTCSTSCSLPAPCTTFIKLTVDAVSPLQRWQGAVAPVKQCSSQGSLGRSLLAL